MAVSFDYEPEYGSETSQKLLEMSGNLTRLEHIFLILCGRLWCVSLSESIWDLRAPRELDYAGRAAWRHFMFSFLFFYLASSNTNIKQYIKESVGGHFWHLILINRNISEELKMESLWASQTVWVWGILSLCKERSSNRGKSTQVIFTFESLSMCWSYRHIPSVD